MLSGGKEDGAAGQLGGIWPYSIENSATPVCAYEMASSEERDYMRKLAKALKHSFGEGCCIYCGHCQPCVMNINIAQVNKFADLAEMQETPPDSVLEHYRALDKHAGDCIGCRACEPNCPFGGQDRRQDAENGGVVRILGRRERSKHRGMQEKSL